MGIGADSSACPANDAAGAVPPILHKLWLGSACMQRREFVSLVSAALLLRPSQVWYHHSVPLPAGGCPAKRAEAGRVVTSAAMIDVRGCLRALGVREQLTNLSDASDQFVQATREFAVLRSRSSDHTHTMVSDVYRLWLLNTVGGIYLDADAFALQPTLYSRWQRCPFVLNVVRGGAGLEPLHEHVSRRVGRTRSHRRAAHTGPRAAPRRAAFRAGEQAPGGRLQQRADARAAWLRVWAGLLGLPPVLSPPCHWNQCTHTVWRADH